MKIFLGMDSPRAGKWQGASILGSNARETRAIFFFMDIDRFEAEIKRRADGVKGDP
jgi:hypothetical protein